MLTARKKAKELPLKYTRLVCLWSKFYKRFRNNREERMWTCEHRLLQNAFLFFSKRVLIMLIKVQQCLKSGRVFQVAQELWKISEQCGRNIVGGFLPHTQQHNQRVSITCFPTAVNSRVWFRSRFVLGKACRRQHAWHPLAHLEMTAHIDFIYSHTGTIRHYTDFALTSGLGRVDCLMSELTATVITDG